ncbi:MAG: lysophospholipid acyltransferase family protein [bacterium]|nr:lysophospholipid acyltransferase family protein [bacterium]
MARTLLAFAGVLPISWMRTSGRILGSLCDLFPNEVRDVSRLNLDLCFPDLAADERRRLARRSLQATGAAALELGALWRWPVDRLEALEDVVEGEELLERAMTSGRGTMLLAPHLGNWEFLNHFLMRRGQLVCLFRPPRVAEMEQMVLQARGRTGCISAPATRGGVRRVLRALRSGELVLILPDQEPLKAHGVSAPFFGVPALTMTLAARILRRTDAATLFVFAERRPSGKFRVRFMEPPEGLADDDEAVAAAALNRGVERCVRLCPEQYLWSYKRFKTTPPGTVTPYKAIWGRRRSRQAKTRAVS